eukprot:6874574-Pyramimonas_sp.AAC.1
MPGTRAKALGGPRGALGSALAPPLAARLQRRAPGELRAPGRGVQRRSICHVLLLDMHSSSQKWQQFRDNTLYPSPLHRGDIRCTSTSTSC